MWNRIRQSSVDAKATRGRKRERRGRGMTAHYSGDKLERKREENVRVDRGQE